MGMGIGNLNGNYDIREIFNSAVFGYMHILENIKDTNTIDIISASWGLIIPFTIVGIFSPIIYNCRASLETLPSTVKEKTKNLFLYVSSSYIWSPIVGTLFGAIVNVVGSVLAIITFVLLGISILPALLGYLSGAAKIKSIKGNPTCGNLTEEMLKREYANQCTQIIINGKKIMGEVLLENSEGYFMHLNRSFLYLSKDGNICIYSKYEKTDTIKEIKDFEFKPSQIENICKNIKASKNN